MTRILLLLAAVCGLCLAQDDPVSGKWTYTMQTPAGDVLVTMDLKVDGQKVTGTVAAGEDRKFPIENGTIEGKTITIHIKRDRPQGGTMAYDLKGTVDGASMKGTTTADVDGEKVTQEWEAKKQ